MSTFAHIETGQVIDPQVNDTAGQYLARFSGGITVGWQVVQVPDGTEPNAKVNGDGTYTNPAPITPQPNNPGNPYFPGYVPKRPDLFWALVLKVFVGLQGTNALGAQRFARLVSDANALGVKQAVDNAPSVDPDDVHGVFLWAVNFLTTTNAASDSQLLLTAAELAAIMQKANWS